MIVAWLNRRKIIEVHTLVNGDRTERTQELARVNKELDEVKKELGEVKARLATLTAGDVIPRPGLAPRLKSDHADLDRPRGKEPR